MVILGINRASVGPFEPLKSFLVLGEVLGRLIWGSKIGQIGQNFEILVFQDIDINDDICVSMVTLDVNITSVAPLEPLEQFMKLGRGPELADLADQNRPNWPKFWKF